MQNKDGFDKGFINEINTFTVNPIIDLGYYPEINNEKIDSLIFKSLLKEKIIEFIFQDINMKLNDLNFINIFFNNQICLKKISKEYIINSINHDGNNYYFEHLIKDYINNSEISFNYTIINKKNDDLLIQNQTIKFDNNLIEDPDFSLFKKIIFENIVCKCLNKNINEVKLSDYRLLWIFNY